VASHKLSIRRFVDSHKPRIRCFIAMVLGRPDVHALYNHRLKSLLREFGPALNIEEIEHGENIDTRILKEIDASDYLLADLTYERPSVYFEAGYALGKQMPVIYTCRSDHVGGMYSTKFISMSTTER
jgi:nucleoside 2-deoxyribosyltransferase